MSRVLAERVLYDTMLPPRRGVGVRITVTVRADTSRILECSLGRIKVGWWLARTTATIGLLGLTATLHVVRACRPVPRA